MKKELSNQKRRNEYDKKPKQRLAGRTFDILKDRVKFSFKPGSISDELIKIASIAAEGDARVGLEILRKAGKRAEELSEGVLGFL